MKKFKKIIISTIFVSVLLASLSGCEKKDAGDAAQDEEPKTGSVYVPEYAQFNIECDYMDSAVATGDTLFVNAATWDEDTGYHGGIYKYDLIENEAQLLCEEEEN